MGAFSIQMIDTIMTTKIDELLTKADRLYYSQKSGEYLRYGQIFMNILHELEYKAYHAITGTEYDCFYDDAKVDRTIQRLKDYHGY